ncbi:MAG: Glucose-responsive transcription factor [Candelina submexicana]|nr:MAG: Glucose-responsive transcription factor [Candelina submexicana]
MASPRPSTGQQPNHPYYAPSNAGTMDNHDEIHHTQRYPSPGAAQMGQDGGPFFAHQHRTSPPDSMQLSAQLSRNAAPMMATSLPDGHDPNPMTMNGSEMRAQPDTPVQYEQGAPDTNRDVSFDSATAPRKRSKTSRACDECRRKKVSLQFVTVNALSSQLIIHRFVAMRQMIQLRDHVQIAPGLLPGASLAEFRRREDLVKELADRLNTLENTVRPAQHNELQYTIMNDGGMSPRQSDYSPQMNAVAGPSGSRKRTYSMSEGLQNSTYTPAHAQRPGEGLPPIGAPSGFQSQYSPNPANGTAYPSWKRGSPGDAQRQNTSMLYESSDMRVIDQEQIDTVVDWDEGTIDEYYRIIHETLPLLANSKSQLKCRLANCSVALREAFLEAVKAAVLPSPALNFPSTAGLRSAQNAAKHLLEYQFEHNTPRTVLSNLMHLQTLILLVLAAERQGPANMNGQSGQSKAEILAHAVGLASNLKLHITPDYKKISDYSPDSDEKLSRRAWLSLVVLDRWHACGTSSPVLIPDTSVVLLPEDQMVLGTAPYQLAQLSGILGDLAFMFAAPEKLVCVPKNNAPLIDKLLQGQLRLFRSSADAAMDSPNLISLAYMHARLLIKKHMCSTQPDELLGLAHEIAGMLNSSAAPVTLLDHHFAALAALVLVDLVDIPEANDGALKGLDALSHALHIRNGHWAREDLLTWGSAVQELIQRKDRQPLPNNRDSLQHLADLAVGESRAGALHGNAAGDNAPANGAQQILETKAVTQDATALTRQGYLTVLAQQYGRL